MNEKTWWKESIVYQIYPRSFQDSDGDGLGDLNGITSRMEYLKQLGINVIWLSPVYESPCDDNGYDISNYREILTDFGTMEDYDRMLLKAHECGIRIVMDLVVNHTSDEHPWFVESRKSVDNPYRDFYIWREGRDRKEPNNWGSCFSGSAWQWDEETRMYYLHLFSKKQPDLNWDNPRVREEVYDMMRFWCEKGIDGFRMDVISMISKDDHFPDGEVGPDGYGDFSPYVRNGPHVHEYLKEMNREVLSKYDLLTVGECSGVTIEEAKRYASADGSELDMVFQFEHMDLDGGETFKWNDRSIDLVELKAVLSKWQGELDGKAWNSLYWCNHDQPRMLSRLGNTSPSYRETSAKMLAICLHMMQGTPYVYQGEELGMTNVRFADISQYQDIETLNMYKERLDEGYSKEEIMNSIYAKGRDNARTPMQWSGEVNAGFTKGTPWLEVNPNYTKINAESELSDPDSVFYYYQKLIRLRKEHSVFVNGEFTLLMEEDPQVFAYIRKEGDTEVLVCANFSETPAACDLLSEWKDGEVLIWNYKEKGETGVLRPYEAMMIRR